MNKIKVMVSSTVDDLLGERDAILHVLNNYPLFEVVGAKPFIRSSSAASSAFETVNMARTCDLYLLVLGERYGYEIDDGRSATEVEFDAAYHQDPTKVLVFLKRGNPDGKQKAFINKTSSYNGGYWRVEFSYSHELQELVNKSVLAWIKDRASIGGDVSYCEHFIREALQLKPTPETHVYYSVQSECIEIEYHAMRQTHAVQFDRKRVYSDFWGSLHSLQKDIDQWSATW